jgi:hypothetical protein
MNAISASPEELADAPKTSWQKGGAKMVAPGCQSVPLSIVFGKEC